MADEVYEYRVTYADERHSDMRRGGDRFRSDEPMWAEWTPVPEGYLDVSYEGLSGVSGIAEATAREHEADGKRQVRIERRVVGPWEVIDRG